MPTFKKLIGTTAEPIVNVQPEGCLVDIIIQNVSANTMYILSDQSMDITMGLKLPAGATFSDSQAAEPIWMIASASSSEARVQYTVYKESTKTVINT